MQTNVEKKKPKVKLSGKDGNVFNLIVLCSGVLRKKGMETEAREMSEKVFASKSYSDAIDIMGQYCELS